MENIRQSNELVSIIRPCPNIRILDCCWTQISTTSQLEYIKQKFPNLQALKVYNNRYVSDCSGLALVKFIRYALFIPNFDITITLGEKHLAYIWTEFTETKNECKNVYISYSILTNPIYELSLQAKLGWFLHFPLVKYYGELPHLRFLSEIGGSIRSLNIGNSSRIPCRNAENYNRTQFLFDILNVCPLLEEIELYIESPLSPSPHAAKYPSLKKITVDNIKSTESASFLKYLSSNLPNLSQLDLIFATEDMKPIFIDIQHMSLDLLTLSDVLYFTTGLKSDSVCIELKTDKGREYYICKETRLIPLDLGRDTLPPKSPQIIITVKCVKRIRIRRLHN